MFEGVKIEYLAMKVLEVELAGLVSNSICPVLGDHRIFQGRNTVCSDGEWLVQKFFQRNPDCPAGPSKRDFSIEVVFLMEFDDFYLTIMEKEK